MILLSNLPKIKLSQLDGKIDFYDKDLEKVVHKVKGPELEKLEFIIVT